MSDAHDPRAIANFILDVASEINRPASNLVLNKVDYFLHGAYLAHFGKPLIDARIEAWDYGPVIREIYHEFKLYRDRPVTRKAMRISLVSGEKEECTYDLSSDESVFLKELAASYLRLRPGTLVDLSHIHDGPWYDTWYHDGQTNPGMEITNEQIESYFKKQARH